MAFYVYKVIYEVDDEDNKTHDLIEYVTGDDLLAVAQGAAAFAEQYEHELKSVQYAVNIVKRYDRSKPA